MRRRISLLVVATTSAVVVSFVIPLCLLVGTLAEDRAMAAADQEARNVAILVSGLTDETQLADLVAGIDQRGTPSTQVLTADGRQLGSGPDMADDADVRRALDGEAFTVIDGTGGQVLLPVVGPDGTAVVRSVVGPDDLDRGVLPAWAGIVGLGVVLLAAALAIASRLGNRISEPLMAVADTAHRLRGGELTARAEVAGTEETQELARALNGLAERTTELLRMERAAVADLSHRLRTPVTALRLDAEAVAEPELGQRLQEHIGVLQRTVDAIVREARRPVRTDLAPGCDATAVVAARMAFWSPLAEDQSRPLEVVLPLEPLPTALNETDLTDLVDVIVDNVFAHTPEGTALRVELRHADDRVLLKVSDSGPGFGRDRVERPGTSGLGLDIATRTAAGAGGSLRTGGSPQGGALVEVDLPVSRH
ncbi:HAMP domain-containing sensor histidine kinase [uncultured Nocardioides sp.]|uniref:HAMP domain-containing sensor histidine kinase n=1 Tax=uncultured Nocardioides sp. TaxID=198441 RepID=UPI00262174AF|nr:HAMP domain-containing sensor histidine kinase [uncultured Nocardioides sp.]